MKIIHSACGHGLKLFKSHFQENGPEDSSSRSCKNSRGGDSLAAATTFVQQQQQTTFLPPSSVTLAQTSSTPLTDFPVPHPPGSISASTVAHSKSKSPTMGQKI